MASVDCNSQHSSAFSAHTPMIIDCLHRFVFCSSSLLMPFKVFSPFSSLRRVVLCSQLMPDHLSVLLFFLFLFSLWTFPLATTCDVFVCLVFWTIACIFFGFCFEFGLCLSALIKHPCLYICCLPAHLTKLSKMWTCKWLRISSHFLVNGCAWCSPISIYIHIHDIFLI